MLLTCVNCDRLLVPPRRSFLYCSKACQQEVAYVRYARAVIRDGRIKRDDVQEALAIQKAWVLTGGYNTRNELTLPEDVRAVVFDRDGGRCVLCGRPATDIDHHRADPTADINDPTNLRGLCAECHRNKTLANLRPIDPETEPVLWAKAKELEARVQAPTPLRLSDDEIRWNKSWQIISKERAAFSKANPEAEQPV
jgi:5-methylcytosine-specific restriction endonuclease McrA